MSRIKIRNFWSVPMCFLDYTYSVSCQTTTIFLTHAHFHSYFFCQVHHFDPTHSSFSHTSAVVGEFLRYRISDIANAGPAYCKWIYSGECGCELWFIMNFTQFMLYTWLLMFYVCKTPILQKVSITSNRIYHVRWIGHLWR